jgi:hypothetical protein
MVASGMPTAISGKIGDPRFAQTRRDHPHPLRTIRTLDQRAMDSETSATREFEPIEL